MSEITGYIDEILKNPENSGVLWSAFFVCFIILLLLIWLLLRGIRLWYWKVNTQVTALKNIDIKLQKLEEGLKESTILSDGAEMSAETFPEDEGEKEIQTPEPTNTDISIGKSGRAYTEEELEKIIRE